MKPRITLLAITVTTLIIVVALIAASFGIGLRPAVAQFPPTANIQVQNGIQPGEIIVSWDAVPPATYYRIGYVNMTRDYPIAKASPTGEWLEAFRYADVNARNLTVVDCRVNYTIRGLCQNTWHAVTVLTSNDVTNTREQFGGLYYWPQNPRWQAIATTDHGAPCNGATAYPTTPTRQPTPTSPAQSNQRHPYWDQPNALSQLKQHTLDLINQQRTQAGVPVLLMGNSAAAQLHANDMRDNECFHGHWGTDGLKPYMRYTLSGGHHSNSETVIVGQCYSPGISNYWLSDPQQEARVATSQLMDSPGHRQNILNPHHTHANIGITIGTFGYNFTQVFESRHATFSQPPTIAGTDLRFSGSMNQPHSAGDGFKLTAFITYHPPPQDLTPRQLAYSRRYGLDTPAAIIHINPTDEATRSQTAYQTTLTTYQLLPNPYDAPSEPPVRSLSEYMAIYRAATALVSNNVQGTAEVFKTQAYEPVLTPSDFDVTADIAQLLDEHGPGVYTVLLDTPTADGAKYLSLYSIFHEVDPPERYARFTD